MFTVTEREELILNLFEMNSNTNNLDTCFVVCFNQNEVATKAEDILRILEKNNCKSLLIDVNDMSIKDLNSSVENYGLHLSKNDFYSKIKYILLETDMAVVIKNWSLSKSKAIDDQYARGLMKILDDAHFKDIYPKSNLIFVDYASYLEKYYDTFYTYTYKIM